MPESLTRAALMEAAVKRVHATHGEQCVVGDNCPGNGVVEHAAAETIAACLPLIADAIEARLAGDRHGCLLHGEDCAACRALNRASGYVADLVLDLALAALDTEVTDR